jgi:hypothetical protein
MWIHKRLPKEQNRQLREVEVCGDSKVPRKGKCTSSVVWNVTEPSHSCANVSKKTQNGPGQRSQIFLRNHYERIQAHLLYVGTYIPNDKWVSLELRKYQGREEREDPAALQLVVWVKFVSLQRMHYGKPIASEQENKAALMIIIRVLHCAHRSCPAWKMVSRPCNPECFLTAFMYRIYIHTE